MIVHGHSNHCMLKWKGQWVMMSANRRTAVCRETRKKQNTTNKTQYWICQEVPSTQQPNTVSGRTKPPESCILQSRRKVHYFLPQIETNIKISQDHLAPLLWFLAIFWYMGGKQTPASCSLEKYTLNCNDRKWHFYQLLENLVNSSRMFDPS